MPNAESNRLTLALAVIDDTLYALGGSNTNNPGTINILATNDQYTPIGYGTVPPAITIASQLNASYFVSEVSLNFSLNKPADWAGYSLDGKGNVTVTGATIILAGLPSGLHNMTIYANDTLGNMGASETIAFTVAKPEAFPALLVVGASVTAILAAGLLVYYKKHKGSLVNKV